MNYSTVIDRLKDVAKIIRDNPRKSFPLWVFELDFCSKELADIHKRMSIEMGYYGKIKENIPHLKHLKEAIVRLSRLCAMGGLSFSVEVVFQTISSTIEDLKLQEKLDSER
ncbi:hypothetical protein DCCM_2767 [Desulfocucumis palustris]|uniref:Uncharacterized protein n=1 Tax=Desulfocucumis palustris TaxID=1898651 RepID=A0A2L2XID8_9FIRM|nr:hypothetical protein [Desulfocucumis palustris]GBF33661.1 hypothetical protein DCCM_2767 [Desulfocucumis palustris]